MPTLDPVRTDARQAPDLGGSSFVFLRDVDEPRVLEVREASVIDRYDIRPLAATAGATSTLYSLVLGPGGLVLPGMRAIWETWLPEIDARIALPESRAQSAVAKQIECVQRVTGLSDTQLAAAFPGGVTRETVNRWRNRPDPNLRPENLYRLGLLHELARRLEAAGIEARVWLHQRVLGDATPYDLICAGRLGDVRRAVESIAVGAVSPTEPMPLQPALRDRDLLVEDREDDEGDWIWDPVDEDAGE